MLGSASVKVTTQPPVEPVSLDLARTHCRIDADNDDLLLTGYLTAARIMAERYLSRALITQTIAWTIRPTSQLTHLNFLHHTLYLPRSPAQSIVSVSLLDTLGNSSTIAPATLPVVPPATLQGYTADLAFEPATLRIGRGTVLSNGQTLRSTMLDSLTITFVAGYGTDPATVPQPIKNAILLLTAFLYEHKGDAGGDMPKAVEWLLDPDRVMYVGG